MALDYKRETLNGLPVLVGCIPDICSGRGAAEAQRRPMALDYKRETLKGIGSI